MTFLEVTRTLFGGFALTCLIFIITLVVAIPLGMALSFGLMSKFRPLKKGLSVFVWIIRGVPLMLQIFIVYLAPGILNDGVNFWNEVDKWFYFEMGVENGGAFIAVLISFIINYSCYFAVIFKGGIEGVNRGQNEAGLVLGMTKKQIFRHVILFQVVKKITPPMSNEIITLVKDTALANSIGILETILVARNFANPPYSIIWPIFYSGVFYLVFVGLLTLLFGYLEKKMAFYKE